MYNQEGGKPKAKSQLIEDYNPENIVQIPSQNYLDPQVHNSDSSKHKQMKSLPTRKSNWKQKQRVKYFVFLNYYSELPNWGNDLKSIPTYKLLAQFVKSRSPQQCKSFHLSIRRNFKTVQQMIRALHEQLMVEEGYFKLLDRYDLEIMAFQQEHKILEMNGLKKLAQKYNETNLSKEGLINGDSPMLPQGEYISKINIRDLLQEKQQQEKQSKIENQNYPSSCVLEQKSEEQQKIKQKIKNYYNTLYPNPTINNPAYLSSGLSNNIHFFVPPNNPVYFSNKSNDKNNLTNTGNMYKQHNISQEVNNNGADKKIQNLNQRLIQQNYKRMLEINKNSFNPFQNFQGYAAPFGDMNRMPIGQYNNQMPFTMPPPGGIPYLLQGYNPYFGTIPQRFPASSGDQILNQSKKAQKQMTGALKNDNFPFGQRELSLQGNKQISQQRKQAIFKCHQHWVNWLRAVNEMNRRKQEQQKLLLNR